MKFILRASVLFFVVSFSIIGCNDSSNQGPCDYTEHKFNMTIIDVREDSVNTELFVVLVDFDGDIDWAENTHTLTEVRNIKTTYDFVVNNNIKSGNIYSGTIHKLVPGSGNCDEKIIDWDQKLRK